MSTESLSKENFKNPKLDPKGSEKSLSGPQYSNVDLNKVQKNCVVPVGAYNVGNLCDISKVYGSKW